MPCLVLCLAWLVALDQLRQFSFVQGATGYQATKIRGSLRSNQQGQKEADPEVEARRLTSRIKKAYSAKKLIDILNEAADEPIFDFIHASAAYTQLVTLKRKRGLQPKEWDSQVLRRLHARVNDMVLQDQLRARQTANVLWSLAQLSDRFSIPTQLLAALVKSVSTKVKDMNAQGLSNSLWACAKLKEIVPDVFEAVPAIVADIPNRAKDMVPQALSNCMWACAKLKDVAPDVLEAVPAIAAQIPFKAIGMKPQELSNCLFAAGQLKDDDPKVLRIVPAIVSKLPAKIKDMNAQDLSNNFEVLLPLQESVPEVAKFLQDDGNEDGMMRSAAARLNNLLPRLSGNDLIIAVPAVIWACATVGVSHDQLLTSVAERFGSQTQLSRLKEFGLCALCWSYQVFDKGADFTAFRERLKSETERRDLSEADVQSSRLGYLKWNRADV
eukprot:s243_g20.t1